jgi:signal transduction histidine kinase
MSRFWQYLRSFVLIAFITAADRVTGTGLGLSICKGIIQGHGGHIWAENLPDGLAFNFTLPLIWDGATPSQLPIDVETE